MMAEHGVIRPATVVAAIDFGTTYSGFSYAHTHLTEDDPYIFMDIAVESFEQWPSQEKVGAQPYFKTQSSLLYVESDSRPGTFDLTAWGWAAWHEHLKLLQNPKDKAFHFIQNFKLALAGSIQQQGASYILPEGFTARGVVSDYLREISSLVVDEFRKKHERDIHKKDIQWCLTVPAIWDDAKKQEMRICAEIAGLVAGPLNTHGEGSPHPVIIVLEPEAASMYCLHHLRRTRSTDLPPGSKILVVDAGGGTVDLTFHKKIDSEVCGYQVEEISRSSGDLCGATFVDEAFYNFLARKVSCYEEFIREHPSEILQIRKNWENLKLCFDGSPPSEFNLPRKLRKYWKANAKAHDTYQPDSDYDDISITLEEMKLIFDAAVDPILGLIEDQLTLVDSEEAKTVTVTVVGGFSASPYLMNRIREKFNCRVKCILNPTHPGKAVVTGAVVCGCLGRQLVTSRVSRKTYGVACTRGFLKTDPKEKLFLLDGGRPQCKDVFDIYARKGDSITVNYCRKKKYKASNWGPATGADNNFIKVEVYSTTADTDPTFVTDPRSVMECTYNFPIPPREAMNEVPEIEVSMYFGRATIELTASALNFESDTAFLPTLTFMPPKQMDVDDAEVIVPEGTIVKHRKAQERNKIQEEGFVNLMEQMKLYLDTRFEALEYSNFQMMSAMRLLANKFHSLEAFAVAEKSSSVPRFVYVIRNDSSGKPIAWKMRQLLAGTIRESFKLGFMCEAFHEDRSLHFVAGQEGIELKMWTKLVRVLVPCIMWSLTIVYFAAKLTPGISLVLPSDINFDSAVVSDGQSQSDEQELKQLSQITADTSKALLNSMKNREVGDSAMEQEQEDAQEVRQNSRKALKELLDKLKIGDFRKKVGLTRVTLKNSHGSFNDVLWICDVCLREYRKSGAVTILD